MTSDASRRLPLPIEDYAAIGDGQTAALIGKNGSIDWLCLPRFDSPACFAALLGDETHGHWLLGPADEAEVSRRYVGHTGLLETTYTTATGSCTVLDVMPVGDNRADLVRRVTGVSGTVRMCHDWRVRMGYGKVRPWVRRDNHEDTPVIVATAGPDKLILHGDRLPIATNGHHRDEFDVVEGQTLTFAMSWTSSWLHLHHVPEYDRRIEDTRIEHEGWAAQISYDGPWHDEVVRSLITLRGLTHHETGGIVAAPTTSLPEDFGGERNWDYRFVWLRDASLTLQALLACGRNDEADLWRGWLLRAVAGDPADMQVMYTVDGGRQLPERDLEHLPGYEGSVPVRIGNGAVDQRQTDVLGEVMCALEDARRAGLDESVHSWSLQRALIEELAHTWEEPDHGLWEIRGPSRHFTHSRVMVWAAFDRAVKAVEDYGFEGPVEHWRELRDLVHDEVMERGFNTERNTFTQHYDTDEVDASLLVLSEVGFVAGADPKMLGTIAAIEEDLMRDGLVLRYRTETGIDGLAGDEHPFLACSFWLAAAYARAGRLKQARTLMERLLGLSNDVGLLSEEYDVGHKRFAGNFPQAFSHLTLVGAAVAIAMAEKMD